MRWLTTHARAAALVAVFAAALGARLLHWHEIRGTALDRWHEFNETDMATYLEQARRLRSGDWLAREPYHPYHEWVKVASPERVEGWYASHSFHQAPGYTYALALAGRALADPLPPVKLAQLALGALAAVLIAWLASELAGTLAGAVAGLMAALYGPSIQLEAQLLREGPALAWLLGITALLVVRVREPKRPLPARPGFDLGLGAAVGAYALFHEMATVALALVVAVVAAARLRAGPRAAAASAACILAGWLLGFAPLLARNLAVGAPPLSVSVRTTVNFVEANVADAEAGGAVFAPPSEMAMRILDAAHGRTAPALAGVLASYHGDVARLVANWSRRLAAVFVPHEEPDNTSYAFYRETTRSLALAFDFRSAFPLGAAGIGLVLAAALGAPAGAARSVWLRAPRAHLALGAYALGMIAALSLVHTVGRFRLYLVPVFEIYSGVAIAIAVAALRARRAGELAALCALAALAAALQLAVVRPDALVQPRPADYEVGLWLAGRGGDTALMRRLALAYERHYPPEPEHWVRLGLRLERSGDPRGASDAYRAALARGESAELRQHVEELERAARAE